MRFPSYLAFTDPVTLTRILRANGGFDLRYSGRVATLYALSLLGLPASWMESALHGKAIQARELGASPLIILGHDRSGTTHLLNLLSLDRRFFYVRPSQMVFPGSCILLDRAMDSLLRRIDYRRPFDDMPVGPGSPQDDEVPLVKLTPHCEYHKYSFPRNHRYWLDTYVFDFSVRSPGHAEWKAAYLGALRKASLLMKRDRPLLKSPATMARLPVVLDLFPDAKFIHIQRDPYKVVPSQLNLHRTMIDRYALEAIDEEELIELTFHQYRGYMNAFLRDRPLIPARNLIEIRYEDFVKDRVAGLQSIYRALDLGDFASIEEPLRAELRSAQDYRGHSFPRDERLRERIRGELEFAFTALGYDADAAS